MQASSICGRSRLVPASRGAGTVDRGGQHDVHLPAIAGKRQKRALEKPDVVVRKDQVRPPPTATTPRRCPARERARRTSRWRRSPEIPPRSSGRSGRIRAPAPGAIRTAGTGTGPGPVRDRPSRCAAAPAAAARPGRNPTATAPPATRSAGPPNRRSRPAPSGRNRPARSRVADRSSPQPALPGAGRRTIGARPGVSEPCRSWIIEPVSPHHDQSTVDFASLFLMNIK